MALLCCAFGAAQAQEQIQAFDYQGVTLLEGPLKARFEQTRDYYLALPNDDLLYGFRERAGLAHPGTELGGWYSSCPWDSRTDEFGNAFGQWLSAFARMYAATGDAQILAKAQELLEQWGAAQGADGYGFYSSLCGVQHYTYDKLVGGLVDMIVYTGSTTAPTYLSRLTDWAIANLDRTCNTATPSNPVGLAPYETSGDLTGEWYTLSENLYRAWEATGDEKYKTFAQQWCYDAFWDRLRGNDLEAFTGLHAYSHINSLASAAMTYRVTGNANYLASMQSGFEQLWNHHMLASGLCGPGEIMTQPGSDSLSQALEDAGRIKFEGPCNVWGGFKVSRYLMSFTGQAKYGDWIETLLYNAMLPCLPMLDDATRRGNTHYHTEYFMPGSFKWYHSDGFPCCSGTTPQVAADFFNIIYFKDAASLYVNLYTPSAVTNTYGAQSFTFTQQTTYPSSDTTVLSIASTGSAEFAIKLRIAQWAQASDVVIKVNGQPFTTAVAAGQWAAVERTWNDGDTLSLTLPNRLHFKALDANHSARAALMAGPVMLAIDGGTGGQLQGDLEHPSQWIEPVAGEPLHYRATGQPLANVDFVPFYEIGSMEKYYVYNDVQGTLPAGRLTDEFDTVAFDGTFNTDVWALSPTHGAIAQNTGKLTLAASDADWAGTILGMRDRFRLPQESEPQWAEVTLVIDQVSVTQQSGSWTGGIGGDQAVHLWLNTSTLVPDESQWNFIGPSLAVVLYFDGGVNKTYVEVWSKTMGQWSSMGAAAGTALVDITFPLEVRLKVCQQRYELELNGTPTLAQAVDLASQDWGGSACFKVVANNAGTGRGSVTLERAQVTSDLLEVPAELSAMDLQ